MNEEFKLEDFKRNDCFSSNSKSSKFFFSRNLSSLIELIDSEELCGLKKYVRNRIISGFVTKWTNVARKWAYFAGNRHDWDFMTVRQRIRIMRKWWFYVTDLLKIIEMSLTLNSNNYFQSIINSSHSIYLNPFVPTQNEPTHGLELQIYLPWLVIWSHIHCF